MRKILLQATGQSFRTTGRSQLSLMRVKTIPSRLQVLTGSMIIMSNFAFQTSVSLNDYYEVEMKADLNDGEMREVQVGPQKDDAVLVAKVAGEYYCISNKCSHYGAPMSQGVLFDDKVKCPWHNATFSVKNGAMDEGPMFDGLQTFPVSLKGDTLTIKVDKALLNKPRTLNMATLGSDPNHYVILGGGPAGQSAAESLRQGGFTGRITIVSAEDLLPYDRTSMSKFLFQVQSKGVMIRNEDFYTKYGIDVKLRSFVEKIDSDNQSLLLRGGESIKYDKLLLATGGSPVLPNVKGNKLGNVFTLRNINDVGKIRDAGKKAKNIVIVGASYIGLESASAIKKELKDAVNITVVSSGSVAFEKTLGAQVGQTLQDLHQQNGINFRVNSTLAELKGDQNVTQVVLSDGSVLEADIVVLGCGINPNTKFSDALQLSSTDKGIKTDAFLKTNLKNVYAAGDVASFPYWATGESVRVEHHNEAVYQGFVAAMNMNGTPTPMAQVPFFWTRQWDKTLSYSGLGKGFDEVIIEGDLKSLEFLAYYAKNGKVIASASMNKSNAQQIISEALRLNVMPTAKELREKTVTLANIRDRVTAKVGASACKREGCCQKKL